jgi:nucleotidyltransferase substrate binding protein (TIGR01987 family)
VEKLETASRPLETLESILDEPFSEIVRDAAIQRFEYSFEACWKALKAYLAAEEGVVCNSPKSCFRTAFRIGLLDEEGIEAALEMTDERNMTSHTYIEAVARRVYERTPAFARFMRALIEAMKGRLESSARRDFT